MSIPFYAVCDRIDINNGNNSVTVFRGDCFICNFTHRMCRNFIDNDFPLDDEYVDAHCWFKGYRANYSGELKKVIGEENKKYKTKLFILDKSQVICDSESQKYLNRADVNAVPLGHWITVKVMSSINLSMRSTDGSNINEKAIMHNDRSFYPLRNFDTTSTNKIADSAIVNHAYAVTHAEKMYVGLPKEMEQYQQTSY